MLSLLPESERARIREWHRGSLPVALPDPEPQLLHEFFRHAAARHPNQVALDIPPGEGHPQRQSLSYRQLLAQARVLAERLGDVVVGECVVAILLARSTTCLYAAQLGVLEAGAAYTCMDPLFPNGQLHDILEDSDAVALLTDAVGRERALAVGYPKERIWLVEECLPAEVVETRVEALAKGEDALGRPAWLLPSSLAYVIYTSGTTGRPKGVMIEHGSIANLVASDVEAFAVPPTERVAQNSSSSYDSSLEETWLAWAAGATLVPMDDDTVRLGPDLVPWMRQERITLFCPPPTMLRTMGCKDPQAELPELSFVYVGGEALPPDVAELWSRGKLLMNGYGPTECTVTATRLDVRAGEAVNIGYAIRGFTAHILDESLEECAEGEAGELCLSGIGLARGYRNRPDLTEQRFPTHPKLGRIYRSGDKVTLAADGTLLFGGRMDAQIKLRGYRIELEAIEVRLAEHESIREAACWVQGEAGREHLIGFVVPVDPAMRTSPEALKAHLGEVLPSYMVPTRIGFLDSLPKSNSGKLDRKSLPLLADPHESPGHASPGILPRTLDEQCIADVVQQALRLPGAVGVEEDFFADLGGDSLRAAMVVSALRETPRLARVTVRDLYETRTIAALALRLGDAQGPSGAVVQAASGGASGRSVLGEEPGAGSGLDIEILREAQHPFLASLAQVLWLLLGLVLAGPLIFATTFGALPAVLVHLGALGTLLAAPFLVVLGLIVYTLGIVGLTALTKRLLIGRYRPLRAPAWGSFYVRHWMVTRVARLIPWPLLEDTIFVAWVLRALGARVGERVHIHRGAAFNLGGWDLLTLGDDASLGQDASLRLVELEAGGIVVGPIEIGAGASLETRAGMDGFTSLGAGSSLAPLASLTRGTQVPPGEHWDGVPAHRVAPAREVPAVTLGGRPMAPLLHSSLLLLARLAVFAAVSVPIDLLALGALVAYGVDVERALAWLYSPTLEGPVVWAGIAVVVLAGPFTVVLEALVTRLLGRVEPGVIHRWSLDYLRVVLKSGLVMSASDWLSGTLFWPMWLRAAGMRVGPGCEISTIIDVVPELIEIDGGTFFADGIYLGGARVDRGTVTLAKVHLGSGTFLGNHAKIPAGQNLPDDVLFGVSTVADDRLARPGSSWFGLPPFELPRREVVEFDRRYTHEPDLIRYLNRVFWELLRFVLPVPGLLLLLGWFELIGRAEATWPLWAVQWVAVPAATLVFFAAGCLLVLVLKWLLLGRVKPGVHPLYSCWCSRWDFHFVVWAVYGSVPLTMLEGCLLLNIYLRAIGMTLGRRVLLGMGFGHVVDPDMLTFEDDSTVSCNFQAHTFEDRVLKIDYVRIRAQATVGHHAVLLYGADIGEKTTVLPHSVVMKRETLLPGHVYGGAPSRILS